MNYNELVTDRSTHASCYTDAHIFADELERIFYRSWVFVGHSSEIPKPGDFVTRQIGHQPVILVRDKEQQMQVLLNRCAHRGSAVCTAASGNTKVFACPYHGWTYDLGGILLGVSYPGGYDKSFVKKDFGMARAARVASYRGFVFASLSADGPSLDEHLGDAKTLIDRACDLSPEGEVELTAGWVRHRYNANWKMLLENDTDGYHLGFVHIGFLKAVNSHYDDFAIDEKSIKSVLRDWGGGHTEIDFAPGYTRPFEWFGGGGEGKFASYMAAMEKQYGKETAQRRIFDGPPHAIIFPNLFLAEMNIVIFQPVSVDVSVQWHTPMFLKGASELNARLLRQSEGALGPASLVVPEDATIAARNQFGLHARSPQRIELGRGVNREQIDNGGRRTGHMTDETTNRGLWRHYRKVMSA